MMIINLIKSAKHLLLTVCSAFLLFSCTGEPGSQSTGEPESRGAGELENNLNGLWTLSSMEKPDSTGVMKPYAGGMQGFLLYEENGHVALHLSYEDFEKSELHFRNFTDTLNRAKLEYLTGSYHYIANYSLLSDSTVAGQREMIIEHDRIAHSNPNDWGVKVQRKLSLKGDTLKMQPLEESNSSIRLVWVRK